MVEIKIYTKTTCPYCIKAKMLLNKLNLKFEEISVNKQEDQDSLIEKTGMMTVPQIFINDKLIGGCDDLYEMHDLGKLKEIIEK